MKKIKRKYENAENINGINKDVLEIIIENRQNAVKNKKRKNRRRPTLPGSFPPSTIGSAKLNYCVRDGNRCDLRDIITGFSINEGLYLQN